MSAHQLVFSGGGHYCSRCGTSWDTGEETTGGCRVGVMQTEKGVRAIYAGERRPRKPKPALPTNWVGVTGDAEYLKDDTGNRRFWPIDNPRPPIVVAFAGTKGAGKDTAADVLVTEHDFTRVRMADGLKEMLRALLRYRGTDEALIERYIEGDLKETPCPALNGRTMRHAMQTLGTDWGRKMIDEDIWVDSTHDRILAVGDAVVSDIRFPNEAEMIKGLGGTVIRIDRDTGSVDPHVSEQLTSGLLVDWVVRNDGTSPESLRQQIRGLNLT